MIKDSNERTKFETGAVRDMSVGKGKFIYMPYDVMYEISDYDLFFDYISEFQKTGDVQFIISLIRDVSKDFFLNTYSALLEVAIHFEEGCNKYGIDNWRKGINISSFVDSATRHYCKHKAGWTDEIHSRGTLWNLICLVWTMKNKPEMDDFTEKKHNNIEANERIVNG